MCEEDKLASAKILEWEQLLTYAGYPPPVEFDAEEIVPACVSNETVTELLETKEWLAFKNLWIEDVERDMKEKEKEMEKRKQELEDTKLELEMKQDEMKQELEDTKQELRESRINVQQLKTKG